jgi:hypothetical protein
LHSLLSTNKHQPIERLPGSGLHLTSKERQARVEAGETVATAVMVGSLPPGFDAERDQEWFPSDLITLLGLSTGRGVLVPFVELRGPAGELVAHLHVSIGRATGERRRSLIDESVDRRVLRETFVGALSADEAAVIAAGLDRAKAAAANLETGGDRLNRREDGGG